MMIRTPPHTIQQGGKPSIQPTESLKYKNLRDLSLKNTTLKFSLIFSFWLSWIKTKNKKSYYCSFNEGVTQFRASEGKVEQGLWW